MQRGSGILLHITSLPSRHGIGDLGPEAYRFVDLLNTNHQTYWQVLPLTITDPAFGNSPYSSISAFAGNPLCISLDLLKEEGFDTGDIDQKTFSVSPIDYDAVYEWKYTILDHVFENFKARLDRQFQIFCKREAYWLHDFALFIAVKKIKHPEPWTEWPAPIRDRDKKALKRISLELLEEIEKQKFFQYIFYTQWEKLKKYANEKHVQVIGDIPIFVNLDSADTWAHPKVFKLDAHKNPTVVAGVPPDYFSETGQLWGNPLYDWDHLQKKGFGWWIDRIRHTMNLYDIVRIDHFRGFCACWEVPVGEKTAKNGTWISVPGRKFFRLMKKKFPRMPIIAEDLGLITDDVRELMKQFDLPGMNVLQFAFGDSLAKNPYVPHNHRQKSIVYTGTHDNNTTLGWFNTNATEQEKKQLNIYLGCKVDQTNINEMFIRLALQSVSDVAIIPLQDVLRLDEKARMNTPGTGDNNWAWRYSPEQWNEAYIESLADMTEIYGRKYEIKKE